MQLVLHIIRVGQRALHIHDDDLVAVADALLGHCRDGNIEICRRLIERHAVDDTRQHHRDGRIKAVCDVEDILFQHPKIELAAVVGVPDAKSGEAVKAYIQLKPGESATEKEILEFAKENMAGYKRPKIVEFRETLPVSNVGKVLRRVLRDEELEKKPAS